MNIKFENKNDLYSFESENIKIEFNEPRVQAWDEFGSCTTEKDILYYYYTVTAYTKEKKKWNKFFELGTYDFPEIITFKNILKAYINKEIDFYDYQKDDLTDDRFHFTHTIDTRQLCEDFYSVTHSVIKEEDEIKNEHYNVVVGKPFGYNGDEMINVSLNLLTKEDVEEIYKCVNGFIEYSIKKTHEINVKRNKEALASWKIIDKKLYEMSPNGKSIETIYTIEDKIGDALIMHGNINSDKFYSTRISNFRIKDIVEDGIIIDEGYEETKVGREYRKIKFSEKIELNKLVYLCNEVDYPELKYNEKQITEDFFKILSDKEKEEFKTETVETLFDKYKEAILNRTWMCRKEHKLPKRVEDTGYNENVYASIKVIIENIKKKLK